MQVLFLLLNIVFLSSFSTTNGSLGVEIGLFIHSMARLPTVRIPNSSHKSNHILGAGFLQGLIILKPACLASLISLTAIAFESG